jgi:hypothetical protein
MLFHKGIIDSIFLKRLFPVAAVCLAGVCLNGHVKAADAMGAMPRTFSADPQTLVASKSALAAATRP